MYPTFSGLYLSVSLSVLKRVNAARCLGAVDIQVQRRKPIRKKSVSKCGRARRGSRIVGASIFRRRRTVFNKSATATLLLLLLLLHSNIGQGQCWSKTQFTSSDFSFYQTSLLQMNAIPVSRLISSKYLSKH